MPTKVPKAKAKPRAKKAVAKRTVRTVAKQEHSNVECNNCKFYNKSRNVDSYLWVVLVGILVCAFTYFNDVYLNTKLTAEEISQATVEGIEKYSQEKNQEAMAAQRAGAAAEAERRKKGPVYVDFDISDDDAVLGDENAPITIVEFSDFECPFCEKFYTNAYTDIKRDYVDTGKAKIIFRDYPLGFHKAAYPAALAANCVREQGGDEGYFQMHDAFYSDQSVLSGDLVENFKPIVAELGYDTDAFVSCLESNKYKDEIQKDMKDASNILVTGTPTLFINGTPIVGSQPYAKFKAIIDSELEKVQ